MNIRDIELRCPHCGLLLAYQAAHSIEIHAGRRRYVVPRATAACSCRGLVELLPKDAQAEPLVHTHAPTNGGQP